MIIKSMSVQHITHFYLVCTSIVSFLDEIHLLFQKLQKTESAGGKGKERMEKQRVKNLEITAPKQSKCPGPESYSKVMKLIIKQGESGKSKRKLVMTGHFRLARY